MRNIAIITSAPEIWMKTRVTSLEWKCFRLNFIHRTHVLANSTQNKNFMECGHVKTCNCHDVSALCLLWRPCPRCTFGHSCAGRCSWWKCHCSYWSLFHSSYYRGRSSSKSHLSTFCCLSPVRGSLQKGLWILFAPLVEEQHPPFLGRDQLCLKICISLHKWYCSFKHSFKRQTLLPIGIHSFTVCQPGTRIPTPTHAVIVGSLSLRRRIQSTASIIRLWLCSATMGKSIGLNKVFSPSRCLVKRFRPIIESKLRYFQLLTEARWTKSHSPADLWECLRLCQGCLYLYCGPWPAYDRVILWTVLQEYGIDGQLLVAIKSRYKCF